MTFYRRALWLYPIFQIPLICLGICLTAAMLFWLFKFGRPQVAVAIAIDLSGSTYGNQIQLFNAPGTILNREVEAVQAYLNQNNGEILRRPNQVKVFGFAGTVKPLTENFESNSSKVKQEMLQELEDSGLPQAIVPGRTNINLAIDTGITELKTMTDSCKELIIVTDGQESQAEVSLPLIAEATLNRIVINTLIVREKAYELERISDNMITKSLIDASNKLTTIFTDNFFKVFNSNLKWIIFWLSLAWISLMWVLVLPLDRWVFQGMLSMTMDISGKLALSHALFWTTITLILLWNGRRIPFLSGC